MLFFVKSDSCDVIAFLGVICFTFEAMHFEANPSEGFFLGDELGGFFQNFSGGGPKVVKFLFSHSKLKKTLFTENFKIQGGKLPHASPCDAHGHSADPSSHCIRSGPRRSVVA